MDRTVYHVKPNGDSMWQVAQQEGAALSQHDTKRAALEAARKVAKNDQPSQVVVHEADGTIETEWTYQVDPYPPKG
jgi:Uncharacterized protein conserved in bacteria (DUF2188)